MSEEGANPNEIKRVSVEWKSVPDRRTKQSGMVPNVVAQKSTPSRSMSQAVISARGKAAFKDPQHSPVSTWQIENALDGQRIFLCGLKRERIRS